MDSPRNVRFPIVGVGALHVDLVVDLDGVEAHLPRIVRWRVRQIDYEVA
ncbi:hypothetical protein ACFRCG_06415 [Embleya sp. NPDC056575]